MNIKTEIKSLSASKSKFGNETFYKYDIDVSLNEVETSENQSKLEYSLVFVSDPRNIRIATEGLAIIEGKESERQNTLEQESNGIPKILQMVYDELFPILFMMTKTMQIPSPSIMLSRLSQASEPLESTSEPLNESENTEDASEDTEPASEASDVLDSDPEKMSLEDLQELYAKLDSEYSSNPSDELRSKMDKIGKVIQKKEESPIDSKI